MEGFLYFFFGEVVGVGYIDYYIRMNYFKFFYIVLVVVIVLSIYFFVKGKYINIGKVMFFYVGWVVLGIIILVGFQYIVVLLNEQVYERLFLEKNIKFICFVYNLEKIEEKYFFVDILNNIIVKDL